MRSLYRERKEFGYFPSFDSGFSDRSLIDFHA
jgi:hypothetical protein